MSRESGDSAKHRPRQTQTCVASVYALIVLWSHWWSRCLPDTQLFAWIPLCNSFVSDFIQIIIKLETNFSTDSQFTAKVSYFKFVLLFYFIGYWILFTSSSYQRSPLYLWTVFLWVNFHYIAISVTLRNGYTNVTLNNQLWLDLSESDVRLLLSLPFHSIIYVEKQVFSLKQISDNIS